jgi:5'-3' exonuclease
MQEIDMTTYALVDFANLMYRCKHVGTGDIVQRAGMALHTCLNSLRMIWRKFDAEHVVICLEGRSWRRDAYPEYKATRRVKESLKTRSESADDEFFFEAMNQFIEFLQNRTNVTVLQSAGVEADDFIARWIQLHPEDRHIIFSGDSDYYQLLTPNVIMYDGVKGWTISTTEVLNEKDKPAVRKRTITEKINGKDRKHTIEEPVIPPNPEYELFLKIMRGDSSDNIMCAAKPGTREEGSQKKPGIREAFNDRNIRGWDWNTVMQTEWDKIIGVDELGQSIIKRVKVIDEYKINQQLIDLNQQPEHIKNMMDQKILEAIEKETRSNIGIYLLRFTEEMALTNIGRNPQEYAKILSAAYPKEVKINVN